MTPIEGYNNSNNDLLLKYKSEATEAQDGLD